MGSSEQGPTEMGDCVFAESPVHMDGAFDSSDVLPGCGNEVDS